MEFDHSCDAVTWLLVVGVVLYVKCAVSAALELAVDVDGVRSFVEGFEPRLGVVYDVLRRIVECSEVVSAGHRL